MISSLVLLCLSWCLTYLIHSTLLLGGVWVWFHWKEPQSHALREAVWKLAAVFGILTATVQLQYQVDSSFNRFVRLAVPPTWLEHTPNAPTVTVSATEPYHARPNGRVVDFATERSGVLGSTSDIDVTNHQSGSMRPLSVNDATNVSASFSDSRDLNPSPLDVFWPQLTSQGGPAAYDSIKDEKFAEVAQTESTLVSYLNRAILLFASALIGSLLALGLYGLSYWLWVCLQFQRQLQNFKVIETGSARSILDELLSESGVNRSVQLLSVPHDEEPGACGLWQWKILVPVRALEELKQGEMRAMLAHELAHLMRGDAWWLAIGQLLSIGFRWQPLNGVAYREWRRASEYLCDSWAVERQVEPLTLAKCLTTVAEWKLTPIASTVGLGSSHGSMLSQRVERLVIAEQLSDPWQNSGRRQLILAASSLVAVAMVCWAPTAAWSNSHLPSTDNQDSEITNSYQETNVSTVDIPETLSVTPLEIPPQLEPMPMNSEWISPQNVNEFIEIEGHDSYDTVYFHQISTDLYNRVHQDLQDLRREMTDLEQLIPTARIFSPRTPVEFHIFRIRTRIQRLHDICVRFPST